MAARKSTTKRKSAAKKKTTAKKKAAGKKANGELKPEDVVANAALDACKVSPKLYAKLSLEDKRDLIAAKAAEAGDAVVQCENCERLIPEVCSELSHCPFCMDPVAEDPVAEDLVGVSGDAPEPEPEEEEDAGEDAPETALAKKDAVDQVATFTRKDYNECCEELINLRGTWAESGYDLAVLLKETKESGIYKVGDKKWTFESFCENAVEISGSLGSSLVVAAGVYSLEEFVQLGQTRARLIAPLPEKTRNKITESVLKRKLTTRETQAAVYKQRERQRSREKKSDGRGRKRTRLDISELAAMNIGGMMDVDGDVLSLTLELDAGWEVQLKVKHLKAGPKATVYFARSESE